MLLFEGGRVMSIRRGSRNGGDGAGRRGEGGGVYKYAGGEGCVMNGERWKRGECMKKIGGEG